MSLSFRVVLAAALAALSVAASPASAALIRVSQESAPGAGDFDANILGFITPFDATGQTPGEVYNYDGFSYAGSLVAPLNDAQQTFFVNTSAGLSLFHIIDDYYGGFSGEADVLFTVFGDTVAIEVFDDIGELTLGGGGTTVTGDFVFNNCCTDGVAFGSLDGPWTLYAANTAPPVALRNGWIAAGDGQSFALSDDPNRRVRFDAVPEPGTMLLFAGGLWALACFRTRTRLRW